MTIFIDVAPDAAGIGIFAAVAFLLIFAAVAFIAFKILKKTLKMGFRMALVAVILLIAVAGSLSFWWLGERHPTRPQLRPKTTQPK